MKYSNAMSLDLHIRYYGKVYVLDDVATMEVGDRDLAADVINKGRWG